MAASLARAARVPAIVLGRIALDRGQVVDAVVATSPGASGIGRSELSRQITRTVGSAEAQGGLTSGPLTSAENGRDRAVWLVQDTCLLGLWPDPPPVAPFVALIAGRPEEARTPWRRDIARVGLVYETERLRAEPSAPASRAGVEGASLAEDLLRMIAIGLVLCDRSGRVIYANAAAERWMRSRGAIAVEDGRLACRRPDLRRRLEEAVQTASVGPVRAPVALALPRGGSDPVPDVVTVLPFEGAPCSLVVFGGRDWDTGRSELALSAIGLTKAERRLVGHLCHGRGLEEAAEEAEVTISTARTYLKRIFAKTGTHRQSELVALLSSLSPPVAVRGPLDLPPSEQAEARLGRSSGSLRPDGRSSSPTARSSLPIAKFRI